jgi:hypothetical protein
MMQNVVSVPNESGTKYVRPTIAPSSTDIPQDSLSALITLRQPEPKADIEPLPYTVGRALGALEPAVDRHQNFDREVIKLFQTLINAFESAILEKAIHYYKGDLWYYYNRWRLRLVVDSNFDLVYIQIKT